MGQMIFLVSLIFVFPMPKVFAHYFTRI